MRGKDDPGAGAAALARSRRALAAARGRRRLDVVLDSEDPGALVRALPADDLFFTISEIGLGDAASLVELASPEQFRTFLDLACWRRDRARPREALPWLRAARRGALEDEAAGARLRAKVEALDLELLDLVLRDSLVVHDLEEGDDPSLSSDRFMRTPEGRFLVEFAVDGLEYAAVRGLLDDLFAQDPFRATRLLSSIRWELPSELEEAALRWRNARLADLGYPDRQEALSWFARPKAGATDAPGGVPARPRGFFLQRLGEGSPLSRAAARLGEDERDHLELELVTAANAVLVAEAVDLGDLEAVRRAVEASRSFIEMGLEAASGGEEERALEVLARTGVKALFQRGFGEVLALKWRAERLFRSGGAGSPAAPLLDPPLGEALAALVRRRPLYFPGLESPREGWGRAAAGAFEPRPFGGRAEVARTLEALSLAEGLCALARRLGLALEADGPLAPRLATLYLTALANERLGRAFAPSPIAPEELVPAARALASLDDPRLASGEPERLLEALARAKAEELAAVRGGTAPALAGQGALWVAPPPSR